MGLMESHYWAMDTLFISFCVLFVLASFIMGYVMVKDYKEYAAEGHEVELGIADLMGAERIYVYLFVAVSAMFIVDLWLLM